MYLHHSSQRTVHRAAIENGWRVHKHTGDDDAYQVQTGQVEYRRGTRDYVRVEYRGSSSRFFAAFAPRAHLYTVTATVDYLSRPFRGRPAAELPPPPAEPYQVVVWDEMTPFADGNDATDFAERSDAAGDMVIMFHWQCGAFFQVRSFGNHLGLLT